MSCTSCTEEEKYLLRMYNFRYNEKFNELYQRYRAINDSLPLTIGQKRDKSYLDLLPEMTEYANAEAAKDGIPPCPECGRRIAFMSKHVKHCHKDLTWEEFVKKHNWQYGKLFYTEKHRSQLSVNKSNFYHNTQEGIEAREHLKVKFSGENNPASRPEVRLKISNSRKGYRMTKDQREKCSEYNSINFIKNTNHAPSRGYTINAIVNGKDYRFRSKTEYIIFLMLKKFNIEKFEFEPYRIEYFDEDESLTRHYILDLEVNGRLFEIKSLKIHFERDRKYVFINSTLQKIGKKLELLTPDNFGEIFKIDPIEFIQFDPDREVISELNNGNCKITLPKESVRNTKPRFLQKFLGEDWETILTKRNKEYENKICKIR